MSAPVKTLEGLVAPNSWMLTPPHATCGDALVPLLLLLKFPIKFPNVQIKHLSIFVFKFYDSAMKN